MTKALLPPSRVELGSANIKHEKTAQRQSFQTDIPRTSGVIQADDPGQKLLARPPNLGKTGIEVQTSMTRRGVQRNFGQKSFGLFVPFKQRSRVWKRREIQEITLSELLCLDEA